MGRARPFRKPGRLVHAQELQETGKPYDKLMAVCGRRPRYDSDGFEFIADVIEKITCPECRRRMR